MDFEIRWDDASKVWIDTIPERLTTSLRNGLIRAIRSGLAEALRSARAGMRPFRFEGDAEDALNTLSIRVERDSIKAGIGFTKSSVIVDSDDVVTAPQPFNYAWAKESAYGADAHRVWLYNPRTGGSTPNRAKLVRWLKAHGGNWDKLPDAPTKETWNDKRREDTDFPPPFVDVDPNKSATDYLTSLIENDGDPLATMILDNPALDEAIRSGWES